MLLPRYAPGARPKLSVIVAADVPRQWLDQLVGALPSDSEASAVEILVVPPGDRPHDEREARHRIVRYVGSRPGATRAELRADGIRHASGELVVLLDDENPLGLDVLQDIASRVPGAGASRTD